MVCKVSKTIRVSNLCEIDIVGLSSCDIIDIGLSHIRYKVKSGKADGIYGRDNS